MVPRPLPSSKPLNPSPHSANLPSCNDPLRSCFPEKVNPTTHNPLHHHPMRRPRPNNLHIPCLQDPFDSTTYIHEPQTPLQHVQHPPSTGGQRVFPLQRLRNRALRKAKRTAAGNKSSRKFPLRHNCTSIIPNTLIIAGDPCPLSSPLRKACPGAPTRGQGPTEGRCWAVSPSHRSS